MADVLTGFSLRPTPPTAATKATQLQQGIGAMLKQLIAQRQQSYALFWSDPVNIAAALGTQAASVFAHDAALVAFVLGRLAAADVTDVTLPSVPTAWAATANPDGTVTIAARNATPSV